MPEAVRLAVVDHAMDEAKHHAFFIGMIKVLARHLPAEDRRLMLLLIPDFVYAFVAPDQDANRAELCAYGLSRDDADQVIVETYTAEVVEAYAKDCAGALLAVLDVFPEFAEPYFQERFRMCGLLS